MEHATGLTIAGVVAVGMACQWVSWRFNLPAILPLLGAGLIAGPGTGLLDPQHLLGDLYFPLISLSVGVILFEGALTLHFREVREVADTVRNLITIGTGITWFSTAAATHYIIGLSWSLSILFGAVMVVTGPTVIGPLLRNVRPEKQVASVLKWEGILIDPIGALLAVLVFDLIAVEEPVGNLGDLALVGFLEIVTVGTVMGLVGGVLLGQVLRRRLLPDHLRDIMVLAWVFIVFAESDQLFSESGLLAVTVMGVLLANMGVPRLPELVNFKEKISILLISVLFVILGASVRPADLALLDLNSLLLLGVILFAIRPLSMAVCTIGSPLNWRQRVFLAWIAPRGIVAASVASLFGLRLAENGVADARMLVPLTVLVIVGTVTLHGITAKPLARWLGLAAEEPTGVLILGAHPWAQSLGLALQDHGLPVRLVDYDWHRVRQARMSGLQAEYASLLVGQMDEELEMTEVAMLLAVSRNDEANALACVQLTDDLGSSNVYQLPPEDLEGQEEELMRMPVGRLLFHPDASFERIRQRVEEGAVIKKTPLTQEFTMDDYRDQYGDQAWPLLAIKDDTVRPFTTVDPPQPRAGWVVVGLIKPDSDDETSSPFVVADTPVKAAQAKQEEAST